jgi:hypothetical protein
MEAILLKANRRISNKKYRMSKGGFALGLRSLFGGVGSLSLNEKVMSAED